MLKYFFPKTKKEIYFVSSKDFLRHIAKGVLKLLILLIILLLLNVIIGIFSKFTGLTLAIIFAFSALPILCFLLHRIYYSYYILRNRFLSIGYKTEDVILIYPPLNIIGFLKSMLDLDIKLLLIYTTGIPLVLKNNELSLIEKKKKNLLKNRADEIFENKINDTDINLNDLNLKYNTLFNDYKKNVFNNYILKKLEKHKAKTDFLENYDNLRKKYESQYKFITNYSTQIIENIS